MPYCSSITQQVVATNTKPTHKQLLRKIYAQPLFMTRNQIARSISHAGDEARLRAFVEKLVAGEYFRETLLKVEDRLNFTYAHQHSIPWFAVNAA